MIFTTLLALTACGLLSAPYPPTFPSESAIVDVAVTVSNKGRPVRGLSADEFVVLEDGAPRTIVQFAHEERALAVTLLLDVSTSMTSRAEVVRSAARSFVEALSPQDVAQVVLFSRHPRVIQDFTSDRDALSAAIEQGMAGESTALRNALYILLKDKAPELDGPPRRRAIVLFSDGKDTASTVSDEQVIDAARTGGVAIYSIDFPWSAAAGVASEDDRSATYLLWTLADATGGVAYRVTQPAALAKTFLGVAQELHSQYNVGFVPARANDGSWRTIMVHIPDAPDLKVRHRPGYEGRPVHRSRR
jgi:VWFA-related protein